VFPKLTKILNYIFVGNKLLALTELMRDDGAHILLSSYSASNGRYDLGEYRGVVVMMNISYFL
jgi:hypothetical protein